MLASDDVLACFIAGNAFTWDDWFRLETKDDSLQPTIDMLLNVAIFAWFGAVCPWHSFVDNNVIPIYRLIPLGILVLLFRRLPMMLAFHKFIHQVEEIKHALFVGFFGPIGVSAIFYLYLTRQFLREIEVDGRQRADVARLAEVMNVVIWFLVCCSIFVHGLSIPLGKLGFYLPRTISTAISSERVSAAPSQARESDADEPRVPSLGAEAVEGEHWLKRHFRRGKKTDQGRGRGGGAGNAFTSVLARVRSDARRPEGAVVHGSQGTRATGDDEAEKDDEHSDGCGSGSKDDAEDAHPEISGPRNARLIGRSINRLPTLDGTANAVCDNAAGRNDAEGDDGAGAHLQNPPAALRGESPAARKSGTATPVGGDVAMGWQRSIRFPDEGAPGMKGERQ